MIPYGNAVGDKGSFVYILRNVERARQLDQMTAIRRVFGAVKVKLK